MEYDKQYSKMFFSFFREIIFIILKLMFFFLIQKQFSLGLSFGCFLFSIFQFEELYLESVPVFRLLLLAYVLARSCSYTWFCSCGCWLNCQDFNQLDCGFKKLLAQFQYWQAFAPRISAGLKKEHGLIFLHHLTLSEKSGKMEYMKNLNPYLVLFSRLKKKNVHFHFLGSSMLPLLSTTHLLLPCFLKVVVFCLAVERYQRNGYIKKEDTKGNCHFSQVDQNL